MRDLERWELRIGGIVIVLRCVPPRTRPRNAWPANQPRRTRFEGTYVPLACGGDPERADQGCRPGHIRRLALALRCRRRKVVCGHCWPKRLVLLVPDAEHVR